ncbi:MAG: substrate-binding domain-containing protein, partial [Spirochaetota bacterium]
DVLNLPAGGDTRLIYKVPPEYLDPAIVYSAAVIAESKKPTTALKLLIYLRGDVARKIFEKAGFMIK